MTPATIVTERRRDRPRILVVSRSWRSHDLEVAFVVRSTAAALSRRFDVEVVVPGPAGDGKADGLFDLHAAGGSESARRWPSPASVSWPEGPPPDAVLIEWDDEGARELMAHLRSDARLLTIAPTAERAQTGIPVVPATLGLTIPVSPLATASPHNGFGFTDYLLVLADCRGDNWPENPPAMAAWIAARFPRRHVVIVADALAAAWRDRSLRGWIHIDTRTDLQRLLAHARVVVDLSPGPLVARECVEAMRFGTPVVVPSGTVAADLAAMGGGLWYRDVAKLFGCIAAMDDGPTRTRLSVAAKAQSDRLFGNPVEFVQALLMLLREPPVAAG